MECVWRCEVVQNIPSMKGGHHRVNQDYDDEWVLHSAKDHKNHFFSKGVVVYIISWVNFFQQQKIPIHTLLEQQNVA